tara:strand:- start:135 stop:866 length:732 start_codon:yes stop_codon:yes gene_type:complete
MSESDITEGWTMEKKAYVEFVKYIEKLVGKELSHNNAVKYRNILNKYELLQGDLTSAASYEGITRDLLQLNAVEFNLFIKKLGLINYNKFYTEEDILKDFVKYHGPVDSKLLGDVIQDFQKSHQVNDDYVDYLANSVFKDGWILWSKSSHKFEFEPDFILSYIYQSNYKKTMLDLNIVGIRDVGGQGYVYSVSYPQPIHFRDLMLNEYFLTYNLMHLGDSLTTNRFATSYLNWIDNDPLELKR